MKFSELKVGMKATIEKTITSEDVVIFSEVVLDKNPVHLDDKYAEKTIFKRRIVHGMLNAGLISAVIGNKMPGNGSIYLSQNFKFIAPVYVGDTVKVMVEIEKINIEKKRVILKTECYSNNKLILTGKAEILKLD